MPAAKKELNYLERRRKKAAKQPAKLSKAQEMAVRIMRLADRHSMDGELSILELKTFLERTEFQDFQMYALRHPDRLFHDIDTDNSGKLNMKELEQMVAGFLAYQREIELKAEAERQAHLDAKARRKNELAQREVDSALSQAAATSYELMDICDQNSRNGLLTVLEIVSFCTAPQYKDFIEWLKADNYKALKSHDVDHSGDISRVELEQIVSNYFDEVGGARCRARF